MRPAMLRTIPMLLLLTATLAFPSCGTDTDRAAADASSDTANAGSGSGAADAGSGDTAEADAGSGDTAEADAGSGDTVEADADADIADTGADDTSVAAPPALGQTTVEACRGETGVDEHCLLVQNASACTAARCDKLVVVFSGGEMGCESGPGYGDVLAGYAAAGYAAVCINYFESSVGSAVAPYVDEATRIDIAVREATTGGWAQAYWSGAELLLEGISHGATAPVILMARTQLDEQPHWQGSRLTAGCFFDGSYDQAATASLLATGALGGAACETPVSYQRWLERYCGAGATAAGCNLATEPKAVDDTITSVLPATFNVRDFKLIECGSNLRPCLGDIIPAAPIEALCSRIDASPTHACSYETLPDDGHLTCHGSGYATCQRWFEALPRR